MSARAARTTKRPLVTLHLPLDMGAAGRILQAVAREYPGSRVASRRSGRSLVVVGDPDEVQLVLEDAGR